MKRKPTFAFRDEHLNLLRAMYWHWEDGYGYGAPGVDAKRPYGNSNVEGDVAEILGWEVDEENGLTEEQSERAATIHRETLDAIQWLIENASVPASQTASEETR